jgi:hypothetical protein
MKKSKFAIGRRWLCERREQNDEYGSNFKPDFHFVIIAKGEKDWEKVCRIELVNPKDPRLGGHPERFAHMSVQPYSHIHLKKYATLVEE